MRSMWIRLVGILLFVWYACWVEKALRYANGIIIEYNGWTAGTLREHEQGKTARKGEASKGTESEWDEKREQSHIQRVVIKDIKEMSLHNPVYLSRCTVHEVIYRETWLQMVLQKCRCMNWRIIVTQSCMNAVITTLFWKSLSLLRILFWQLGIILRCS